MRKLREGLWQGDFGDLHRFKDFPLSDREPTDLMFDLAVHVGTTAFVPPELYTIHFPMIDDTYPSPRNDWDLIVPLARYVSDRILEGRRVLVNCDAGVSRSVVFCGLVIALLEDRPMDATMLAQVQYAPGLPPHLELWHEASGELEKWREMENE